MKKIHITILFFAVFALFSPCIVAQDADASIADETIEVAFRKTDKTDLLGGVSVIDMTDMLKKAYSTYSLDFVGNVIGGVNTNIWGMDEYLVLVDGYPRDANNVLPTEIEQISVLKGAAAVVLYGSRAAKGVIMITTKRGKTDDRKISIIANTGFYVPKSYPEYLGSAEYMTLYNEARVNDGLTPLYSATDIYNYGSGENPYRYPDLNFYSSDYLKSAYNRSEIMSEIEGGSRLARFYTTVGIYNAGSLLNFGNTKDDYTRRFFVRGNIDLALHELITANVDANVTFYDSRTANGNFWGNAATFRPNRVSPLIPISYIEDNDELSQALLNASNYIIDGKYFLGGTQLDPTNPIASGYAAGESRYISRQYQFNAGINFNLRNVLQGLFFRAKYGVDYAATYNQSFDNNYATYSPTWSDYNGYDVVESLTKYGEDSKTGNQNVSNTSYRSTNFFSGQFDYSRTYNADHNVLAMLIANAWQTTQSGQYHRTTNMNLGLQLSYNYQHKYYADFSSALPYSAKLPEGKRMAFSPVGTLGWRLTKENFLSEQTFFDDLVLNASYGIINQDIDIRTSSTDMGYYLYKGVLQTGGWWSWGDLQGESATEFQRGENPNLTYVKRKELSFGIRGSLLNKMITFDANYFKNKMDGGIVRASSLYPIYFSQVGYPSSSLIPYVNYNIDDREGIDFSLYVNKKAGDVDITLGVSGLYYDATIERRDENYEYDYQTRMGTPLNGVWGLQSLGFFRDQADIDNSPNQQFGEVQPGDIKYKDQNGDGQIDSNDEIYLGRGSSPFSLGLNLTLKWHNLSFFAMGTGVYGGYGYKSSSYYWVRSDNKYSDIVRNRWTESTKNTATYPRLTTTSGDNNFRNSDFWMYSSDAFRLSQVQLTYDLPRRLFSGYFIKGVSAYLAGYNLLTISKERKHLEMNVGSAPQTRFYNLGLKAEF